MPRFLSERRQPVGDLSTVESQRNDLAPEEFPEGPYGADIDSPSLGKVTPWRADQHFQSSFDYENKELHEGMSRGYPGDDPLPDGSAGTTD
ncbi:hypothetical protein [Cohnella nanjingensis]|uniref:Cytosolic protein n=1 Tax=Cohnella nanjingensis TaxID=1387779 RepID=A0A7X0RLV9_9BACL|nr:hypothetical protein [Cohnella nanjingensis]MBB6669688.1 hypothetical protein [Cohnella nanjingensis]